MARISPPSREAVTHRNLGDTLVKLGQTRRARDEYEPAIALSQEALGVNPADVDSLSLQALCHAKLGRRADAERLASQVLVREPLPATARYRAAVALVLAGNADGVTQMAAAIQAGYSPAVAGEDDDLASVRSDPVIAAALGQAAMPSRHSPCAFAMPQCPNAPITIATLPQSSLIQ